MKYETIKTSKQGKIFTISLNRPDVHNAMNDTMMKELTNCFNKISIDDVIKVVVLTGIGKSFCAGADLNWMKSMSHYSKEENIQDSELLLNLYESVYNCAKPVIGKINGHAFGGGVGLVAVCDITFALPEKKFAFSETKLGIIPSVISTFVVRRIGLFNMRRLFITGERFTSEYAKEIGLIDYIVSEDEIDNLVNKYINLLLSSGPKSIIEIKNLVDKYQKMHLDDYKKFTVEKIAELRVSKEGQEGISAFLEKRKPDWSE